MPLAALGEAGDGRFLGPRAGSSGWPRAPWWPLDLGGEAVGTAKDRGVTIACTRGALLRALGGPGTEVGAVALRKWPGDWRQGRGAWKNLREPLSYEPSLLLLLCSGGFSSPPKGAWRLQLCHQLCIPVD